jgi:hypothetical protein
VHHDVRPDSMLTLHAAREVVNAEGFQELLDGVRGRVDEIESLHRTRELTVRRSFSFAKLPLFAMMRAHHWGFFIYTVQRPQCRRPLASHDREG